MQLLWILYSIHIYVSTTYGLEQIICHLDTDTVACDLYSVMTITSSTYGRNDGTTCADGHGPYSSGFQCTMDSTNWVIQKCQNKQTCSIHPRDIGTDPCPNKYKYMTVLYTCSDINECASFPCQNGGTCADVINGYVCTCHLGYAGVQCEENIDECASIPCQNGGTCTNLINGYTCTCDAGYTGVNCDENIDECASSPCQHGGTCTDGINGYICVCVKGYTRHNCEENYDECGSNPCQHGGTCIDEIDDYTCNCNNAYKGTNCAESNDLFDVNYTLKEHQSTHVSIKEIIVMSRLNCARSCTLNHECYGFKYNVIDNKCQMISESPTSAFGKVNYYVKQF